MNMTDEHPVWCSFGISSDFWRADPSDGHPDWPKEGLTLVEAVKYARQGDRRGLSLALPLLDSIDNGLPTSIFVGSCATEPELVSVISSFHHKNHAEPHWWRVRQLAEILYHSKYAWTIPLMMQLYCFMWDYRAGREADILETWMGDLLVGRDDLLPTYPGLGPPLRHWDWHLAMKGWAVLQEWRRVVDRVGSVHVPIMYGRIFDVCSFAAAQRRPIDNHSGRWANREVYESVTGADCSNWYKFNPFGQRPLQVNGEIDRFFAEDAHRYQPGKRYFLGHEVPQIDDPHAVDLMNQAIAFFDEKLREVDRKYLICAGIIEDDEEDEDEDEVEVGFDHYAYTGIDAWTANPNGSAWDRIAHAAQNAVLGDFFRLVDEVIFAAEMIPNDRLFDLRAIQILADAGPSEQLRRLVTLAEERPDQRWQELCCLALAGSGLGWALEAAGDIACRIDPDTAEFGTPWMQMWRRVMPKLDMETVKLARARDRVGLGNRIREHTSRHDLEAVLWEGQPLNLRILGGQLERLIRTDPPAPAHAAELRHLLQTMTGVDLSMIWTGPETIDPAGVRRGLTALRADANYVNHEPGSRLFFGNRVPFR